MSESGLKTNPKVDEGPFGWKVPLGSVFFDTAGMGSMLRKLELPCFVVRDGERIGLSHEASRDGPAPTSGEYLKAVEWVPPFPMERLGDPGFGKTYGTRYAYYAGAMATGIASEELVIALGREGFLGSFGAAGLLPGRVKEAVQRIQAALPEGPYMFNLIHSPIEPALERECVDLYLAHRVRNVEAAAYLDLTPHVVRYRVAGLEAVGGNRIEIRNRVIAKVSRKEVATKFMEPPPQRILGGLVEQGLITEQQARLSEKIPMADDITVEADSAGHTDNRPMLALLPSILALREEIQSKYGYEEPIRVGAGGGIGTPTAALAVFIMGAAYVVTGSVNQSCVEAGTSEHVKNLLAEADMADVIMAPAADMFEMGVKLQVLKRGTLFAMRAQKLSDIYRNHASVDDIPAKERATLEKQIFRNSLESIWESTAAFFAERDPSQIEKAKKDPKRKMGLIFRWYLGLSSRWALTGEAGREMDYQVWCGPSMGAFNAWVRNSCLEQVSNRKVADVAREILSGAAFTYRIRHLSSQGVRLSPDCCRYDPQPAHP